jgi:REP element-mobilizing transposase RayT
MAQSQLKEPPFTLSAKSRTLAEETIRRHCEIRGWALPEPNVRTNHVHVVVTKPVYSPETVREQFDSLNRGDPLACASGSYTGS